jgi:hypothetical protein
MQSASSVCVDVHMVLCFSALDPRYGMILNLLSAKRNKWGFCRASRQWCPVFLAFPRTWYDILQEPYLVCTMFVVVLSLRGRLIVDLDVSQLLWVVVLTVRKVVVEGIGNLSYRPHSLTDLWF